MDWKSNRPTLIDLANVPPFLINSIYLFPKTTWELVKPESHASILHLKLFFSFPRSSAKYNWSLYYPGQKKNHPRDSRGEERFHVWYHARSGAISAGQMSRTVADRTCPALIEHDITRGTAFFSPRISMMVLFFVQGSTSMLSGHLPQNCQPIFVHSKNHMTSQSFITRKPFVVCMTASILLKACEFSFQTKPILAQSDDEILPYCVNGTQNESAI